MNDRRSRADIERDNRANKERADANPDCWILCQPTNNPHGHYAVRSEGYEVCEIKGQMHIRRPSGQLFPTVAPVEVAPVLAAEQWDTDNENCLTCRFNRNWECRRNAAVAAENGFANWAKVEPDDWCGEYQDIEVHGP